MDADDTTYFQVGDWHDTIYDGSGESTVRFYTDNFVGKMVVHCHVLEHEDQGMMGLYEVRLPTRAVTRAARGALKGLASKDKLVRSRDACRAAHRTISPLSQPLKKMGLGACAATGIERPLAFSCASRCD